MTISVIFESGNVTPRIVRITTTSTLAQVSTAGWYSNTPPNQLQPSDQVEIAYAQGSSSAATAIFSVSIASGVVTLSVAESSVVTPTIANHIATYTNTTGTLSEDPATAISGGNIQAGLSGTAGYLASFPTTAANGSFRFTAVGNAGNFIATLSPISTLGQATVYTLPDVGAATGQVIAKTAAFVAGNVIKASGTAGLVVDAGFALHAGTTAAYAGGGTSNAFVTTNMTSASIVTATILAQTNAASIVKAVPGTNTLTVTFSADPGANTTVNWISTTAVA